jgi:translocation and assembly module TamB
VDIEIKLGEESDIYFVIPGLGDKTIDREGIVRFVVKDTIWSRIAEKNTENEDNMAGAVQNLNLFANLEISEGAQIHIIIDPVSDEELYIKGNGNLSMTMQGTGSPSLTGRFDISDGTYSLTLFEVLKRNFSIREGSYLQWNGEIMDAYADITAVYEVRPPPCPL